MEDGTAAGKAVYTVEGENGQRTQCEITAEQIYLSVGAVNEPSPLSIKG